jgi:putative DNA primase/helicase
MRGLHDATTDEATIHGWWSQWPAANIAIATGAVSGLVVLDIDVDKGGLDSVHAWERKFGALPETLTSQTGSGGQHHLFQYPGFPVKNRVRIAPGIDVRGDNGYVVAPPSNHISGGSYSWATQGTITVAPDWLLNLFAAERESDQAIASNWKNWKYSQAALRDECEQVRQSEPGTRNDTLNRAAFNIGQLVAGGELDGEAARDALMDAALASGLGASESVATIKSGLAAGGRQPRRTPESATTSTPHAAQVEIQISANAPTVVDAAEQALASLTTRVVYQRGGILVRIIKDTQPQYEWLRRPPGAPVITPISDAHLLELMAESAKWVKWKVSSQEWAHALPPKWAVQSLAARGTWMFPHLELIVDAPVLRPNGTVLDQPGYDPATRSYFDPGFCHFLPVASQPGSEDVNQALRDLLEPLVDFPFVTCSDKAVVLAAILTVLARPAIAGPCPMFAFRATAPGSGKSLLADIVALITTGRPAARMSPPRDSEESRKRILAIALEGSPIVLIDNVEGSIGSETMAAALTSESWTDRVLGISKNVTVPLRAVWICTGNNVGFRGDLGRRVLVSDLDPGVENPEDRTGFMFEDLKDHVLRNRARYAHAALSILRGYVAAGRPRHGKPEKGSYELWDRLIRGAVVWAAKEDPIATTERVRREADLDVQALRQALFAWHAVFGSAPTTTAMAAEKARTDDDLRAGLLAMGGGDGDRIDTRKLGGAISKRAGRVVGGLRFIRIHENRNGLVLWSVQSAGSAGSAGSL